jgi:hypothetical protein
VTAVKVNADAKTVGAYLDAKGEDLTAFTSTFKGNAVKVTAKHGARAVSDVVIL